MNIIPQQVIPQKVKFDEQEIPLVCEFLRKKGCSKDIIRIFISSHRGGVGICEMDSDGISGIEQYTYNEGRIIFWIYPESYGGGGQIFRLSEIRDYFHSQGLYLTGPLKGKTYQVT